MTFFILEDEDLAADRLARFARTFSPDAQLLGKERSAQGALAWLQANPVPDLIFSDIELLDGNVFQLWEQFTPACPVIFTTAYDQFLLRAFQTNGIAYLLKPFDYEQFSDAMSKFERLTRLNAPAPDISPLNPVLVASLKQALQMPAQHFRQRFTVKKAGGIYLLQVPDIIYFQAEEKVVFAYTTDGKRHALTQSLQDIESELNPNLFFRLNRSDLIHLTQVDHLESFGKDRLAVHLRGTKQVLVSSATKTAELRLWLEG